MAVVTVPEYVNASVALACGDREMLYGYLDQLSKAELDDLLDTVEHLYMAIIEVQVDRDAPVAAPDTPERETSTND